MKSTYLFITILVFVFASCKKDYTCTCIIGGDVNHSTTSINDTKSNATKTCDEKDNEQEAIECSIND
jgi:hypothetical protein